jgi:quercetin dioxygenase-like cupin family protein
LPGIASSPDSEHPLTRETVLDVRLPKSTPLDRIEVRRIQILPGHPAGLHVHNGPVVGSIVEGSVIFQVEGEEQSVLGPGEVFYEPEGARIARFDAGDDGATFLAYFPLSAGQEPAIAFPDQKE